MSQNDDRRIVKVVPSASCGLPFQCISLNASTRKINGTEDRTPESTGERRRLSRVRHDDRGNAYVEWIDAPAELVERPKLEIQGEPAELQLDDHHRAYDPYSNRAVAGRKTGNTSRTDLRKLSEWIKLKRELEERKRNGGIDDEADE
jgi:hypothetical protein